MDKFSNLHIFFQNGARTFNYSVVSPRGELLVRQTYEYETIRPRLQPAPEGSVQVLGLRVAAPDDLPRPKLAQSEIPDDPARPATGK